MNVKKHIQNRFYRRELSRSKSAPSSHRTAAIFQIHLLILELEMLRFLLGERSRNQEATERITRKLRVEQIKASHLAY